MNINKLYWETYNANELKRFLAKINGKRDAAQQKWKGVYQRYKTMRMSDKWLEKERERLLLDCGYEEDEKTRKHLENLRENKLDEMAPSVKFVGKWDQWWKIRTSSTCSYSSQGFGKHQYAKAILKPQQEYMISRGLVAEIRFSSYGWEYRGSAHYYTGDDGDYQLWANCPEWMADAAQRQITFEFVSKSMGRSVNLKVYNPFLSDESLDKHFAQSY